MSSIAKTASLALTGLAVLALPASAMAQDSRCISRSESRAVVTHLMPVLVDSVAKKCRTTLGRDAYLSTRSRSLSDRLTPQSRSAWPAAKRALERQSGSPLPDNETLLQFGRVAIADGVAKDMDRAACATTNDLLEQLAPLPPRNLANVFALFLETGLNNAKDSPLKVCKTR